MYDLKWSELDQIVGELEYQIYEAEDEEICNFKIIDDSKIKLFERYKKQNTKLTYIQWLEDMVINGMILIPSIN